MSVERPYNGGQWTQARFNSFVKSALRKASMKWPPIHRVRKKAWVKRGYYKCVGYSRNSHTVSVTLLLRGTKQRAANVFVDHICPVVDGLNSSNTWGSIVERMFVEEEGLQVLCKKCHDAKTADERKKRNKK